MRVDVRYGLAGVTAGVEHHTITALADALGARDLVRRGDHLVQQSVVGFRECCHVLVVLLRNHQDVRRRLGVDVAERYRPVTFQDKRRWHFASDNGAEQAVGHSPDRTASCDLGHVRGASYAKTVAGAELIEEYGQVLVDGWDT